MGTKNKNSLVFNVDENGKVSIVGDITRKSIRQALLENHPDHSKNPNAEAITKELNARYESLKNNTQKNNDLLTSNSTRTEQSSNNNSMLASSSHKEKSKCKTNFTGVSKSYNFTLRNTENATGDQIISAIFKLSKNLGQYTAMSSEDSNKIKQETKNIISEYSANNGDTSNLTNNQLKKLKQLETDGQKISIKGQPHSLGNGITVKLSSVTLYAKVTDLEASATTHLQQNAQSRLLSSEPPKLLLKQPEQHKSESSLTIERWNPK